MAESYQMIKLLDPGLSEQCEELVGKGKLVVFPTETVYGIGGAGFDDSAWNGLRNLKPDRTTPFSFLVSGWEMMEGMIEGDVGTVWQVVELLMPGPVTLVVQAAEDIDRRFVAEDGSIGVRMPAIDRLRDAIETIGTPWVHTSANLSREKGVQRLRQVHDEVLASAGLVIDGGTTALGGESTVLDLRQEPFEVLRSGVVPEGWLRQVLNDIM